MVDDATDVGLLVVVDARLVILSFSRSGGSDVGRNPTDELEGGLEVVVVVLANVEVGRRVVVVVVVRTGGFTIFELVTRN